MKLSLTESFKVSGNDSAYGCVGQIGLSGKVSFGHFTHAATHLKHTPFIEGSKRAEYGQLSN
jgi:hypothetical protein